MTGNDKLKPIKITKKEKEAYLAINDKTKASVDAVQQALRFFETRRIELVAEKKAWWKKIYIKYGLDPNKDHNLNFATQIITEREPKPIVPVVKEGTVKDL